jgi:hypothetical protein
MVISILALTLSMGVFANADPRPGKAGGGDDVELLTIATGSAEVPVPVSGEEWAVSVQFDDETFTQEAGSSVLMIATLKQFASTMDPADCNDFAVAWQVVGDEGEYIAFPDTIESFAAQNVHLRQLFPLEPFATPTTWTIQAFAGPTCELPEGVEGSFTVDVEVTVLALR